MIGLTCSGHEGHRRVNERNPFGNSESNFFKSISASPLPVTANGYVFSPFSSSTTLPEQRISSLRKSKSIRASRNLQISGTEWHYEYKPTGAQMLLLCSSGPAEGYRNRNLISRCLRQKLLASKIHLSTADPTSSASCRCGHVYALSRNG